MKRTILLSLVLFLAALASAKSGESGLIAHWNFERAIGMMAEDITGNGHDLQLHNTEWANGAFGNALKLTGFNSYANFSAPQKLNGSPEMSIALWALLEKVEPEYPNIFSCGWNPGGIMIFGSKQNYSFRLGRPNHRAHVATDNWKETGAQIGDLPIGKWAHIAVTFKRPNITTYLNGKKVDSCKWDENIGFETYEATIGKWGGPSSFNGLIDDFRIYNRQLTPTEVTTLANPKSHASTKYTAAKSMRTAKDILTLNSTHATLTFGEDCLISSIKLKQDAREMLDSYTDFITVTLENNAKYTPRKATLGNHGIITAKLPQNVGYIRFKAEAPGEYFRFTIIDTNIKNLKTIRFCQVMYKYHKYSGGMCGLASDDEVGLGIRCLNLRTVFRPNWGQRLICAENSRTSDVIGCAAALYAAPRQAILPILKRMQADEPVPKSTLGGPFSLQSENTRGSYVFADLNYKDTDRWIDLAKRGGFEIIHLHGWWKILGHYDINTTRYPNGIEDMKKTVDKIHAAGLKAGIHTLTACINPSDSWVSPVPSNDLIASATYTLAKPFGIKDTTLFVNEMPISGHEIVWSYSCNGNAIKIGSEIIRYSEISRTPPYAFKKCERGAFKTKPAAHNAGDKADYLQQRYIAFYPIPDSKLADELADAIASKYNALTLDDIYFDGSEGMMSRYGIDTMRWKIFTRLNRPALVEASEWGHNNWWFHTRIGAWDHPCWAMRRNHDAHIAQALRQVKGDLLKPQLGWWAPRGPSPNVRGQFIDELEYFAAKNHGIDGPMSIQGVSVSSKPWNARRNDMMTILGWHERARLANLFTPEDTAKLAEPQKDFQLRLDNFGHWKLFPLFLAKKRLTSPGKQPENWSVNSNCNTQPLKARIEALYTANTSPDTTTLFMDFSNQDNITSTTNASFVNTKRESITTDIPGLPKALQITATNNADKRRGAWTRINTTWEHPFKSMNGAAAFGIWVHGDASGTLLNVQFNSPYMYGAAVSDHYIDIDFKGWKHFILLFRERDAERMGDYAWPYSTNYASHANTRNSLDREHISSLSVFLNNLAPKSTTSIAFGPITIYPQYKATFNQFTLTANGKPVIIREKLFSGDYIEFPGNGLANHFNERGELISRFKPECPNGYPNIKNGNNSLSLTASEQSARAEVTLFTNGKPFGTQSKAVNWDYLKLEYDMPLHIFREDGTDNAWNIIARNTNGASPNDFPALSIDITAISAGNAPDNNTAKNKNFIIDPCNTPDAFKQGGRNNYAQFVFDSENQGTAKPGVTFNVSKVNSDKSKDGALRFTATSKRKDSAGWAAIGQRFPKPIDISKAAALGLNIKGNILTASFKVQLRDTKGVWHDMVTTDCNATWGNVDFPFDSVKLNLRKIDYILYYFNGIPAGKSVSIDIDNVMALMDSASLVSPTLNINGTNVTFSCTMNTGNVLKCRDGRNWTLYAADDTQIANGTLPVPLPTLKPGPNAAKLSFKQKSSKHFHVIVESMKKY